MDNQNVESVPTNVNEEPKNSSGALNRIKQTLLSWIKRTWKDQEARNAIQSLANLATTVSALLALGALGWTIIESNKRESQEQIRNLQRPMIYSIIRDRGGISIEEIRSEYNKRAVRAGLPREFTRENELNKVLLSLLESHVILLNPKGQYFPTLASTMQEEAVTNMLKQMNEQQQAADARSRILTLVEEHSGDYTTATIFNKLKEEGQPVSFELVVNLVNDLRAARLVFKDEQKHLYDTHDER
jgi:hypothetical protein